MNLNQLKKAAKRFSAEAGIPLNEAQEKISSYFGFKNFDAAVKALSSSESSIVGPVAPEGAFWLDLSRQEFHLLVTMLTKTRSRRRTLLDERCAFLVRTVFSSLFNVESIESVQQFLEFFELERLDERYGRNLFSGPAVNPGIFPVRQYLSTVVPEYVALRSQCSDGGNQIPIPAMVALPHQEVLAVIFSRMVAPLRVLESLGAVQGLEIGKTGITLKQVLAEACEKKVWPDETLFDLCLHEIEQMSIFSAA